MSRLKAETSLPKGAVDGLANRPDHRALIAVDLGAESCRVSLLRWKNSVPHIELVHRFANGAVATDNGLRWDLARIVDGVEEGLRRCSAIATEGVRSIAVDGWAVDYVRLDEAGIALGDPYCYRDPRNLAAETSLHARIKPERLRELTGVQLQPLNTLYQHHSDALHGVSGRWLNLPEYLLYRWGGRPVSERTNATHTGMVGLDGMWNPEVFEAARLNLADAPEIVEAGTDLGAYNGSVEELHGARLIAPCCHDTASAVAGIPASGEAWAYISSGTWSLVGTVLDRACHTAEASAQNFTNLSAAGGRFLFHKGIHGMWLLQQCLVAWKREDVDQLVAAAGKVPAFAPEEWIDVDDPLLAQPGDMPARINAQRAVRGLGQLQEPAVLARLIFDSLAAKYAAVLRSIASMTGKTFHRIYIVGGGSRNELLNELTAKSAGIPVSRGAVESSTVGNFAVQLATLNGKATAEAVAHWAAQLQ